MAAWENTVRPVFHLIGWLALALLLVVLLWTALNRPVTSVMVEGALTTADRSAVQQALEPNLNLGLLRLDLDEVVSQVNALEWPQSVSVRRVWPNQLVVGVVKQQVVATWNGSKFLTSTGKIVSLAGPSGSEAFSVNAATTASAASNAEPLLPELRATTATPAEALEIYQRLAALTRSQVADAQHNHLLVALSQDKLGEWQVTLAPTLLVKLGSAQSVAELGERLQRFFVVRQQQPDDAQRRLRYADARYESGVALNWAAQTDIAAQDSLSGDFQNTQHGAPGDKVGSQDSNL